MCSYFNPDCPWCEEYEAKTAICAKLGHCTRDEYDHDTQGCKGCDSLILDSVTAYRCSRTRCLYIED